MKVFLSHSVKDNDRLQPLETEATQLQIELYRAEYDLRPGDYVADKVQERIRESDLFFVLITKRSEYSAYVHQEIGYAEGQNKPVIPLVEPGVDKKNLGMLEGREYISFDPEHPETYLEKVEAYIQGLRAGVQAMQEALVVVIIITFIALLIAILTVAASKAKS